MKRFLYITGVFIFLAYLAATSFFIVKETEYVLVAQFGKVIGSETSSGLHLKYPDPIQTVTRYDSRLQILKLNAAEMGTRDRRNVVIENTVFWKISDPELYRSSVRVQDVAEQRLESLVYSEVGSAIGASLFEEIFAESKRSRLESIFSNVTESVGELSERELGIEVVAVRPTRTSFPKQNLLAIYKRMESEWTRRAKQLRAEGKEEAAKIKSETEKEVRELKAKAYKESQIIIGAGEAKAALLYANAFEKNQDYYTFTRKMETYKNLLKKDTNVILSTDNPLVKDLLEPPEKK